MDSTMNGTVEFTPDTLDRPVTDHLIGGVKTCLRQINSLATDCIQVIESD